MIPLRGRTAVVTGASGGIGSALCRRLCAEGVDVVAVGRNQAALMRLAQQNPGPGQLIAHRADLLEVDAVDRLAAYLRRDHPDTSLLVHAAGAPLFGLFDEQTEAQTRAMFELNTLMPLSLTRALLPQLSTRKTASVVAVGSTFGSIGFAGYASYSASKFALRGLFEALAREFDGGNVSFQYLSPRATATAFNDAAATQLNRSLGSTVDDPDRVAAWLLNAIRRSSRRAQYGWPEKFFARLNGLLPELVDRALRGQLSRVRACAAPAPVLESCKES